MLLIHNLNVMMIRLNKGLFSNVCVAILVRTLAIVMVCALSNISLLELKARLQK